MSRRLFQLAPRQIQRIDHGLACGAAKRIARGQTDPDEFIRCNATLSAESLLFLVAALTLCRRDGDIAQPSRRRDASPFSWAINGRPARSAGRAREADGREPALVGLSNAPVGCRIAARGVFAGAPRRGYVARESPRGISERACSVSAGRKKLVPNAMETAESLVQRYGGKPLAMTLE